MKNRLSWFLAVALLAGLSPRVEAALKESAGHVDIQLKVKDGSWKQVGILAFDETPRQETLQLPGFLFKGLDKAEFRLKQPDNDETQYDYLALEQGGRTLKALEMEQAGSGASLMAKLSKADLDVAEMHGKTLLAEWKLAGPAPEYRLVLKARSSLTADLTGQPFQIFDGFTAQGKPRLYEMGARDGSSLRVRTAVLKPSSGHPAAPLDAELKVEKGRLKGWLDFNSDNDPGDSDFATLLAFNAEGKDKAFKVGPLDSRWGRAEWAYGGKQVAWQHMRYDFDVPVSKLPRLKDGKLGLAFLAYGTCSTDEDAFVKSIEINGATSGVSMTANTPADITVTAATHDIAGYNPNYYTGTVTAKLLDPYGDAVFVTSTTVVLFTSTYNCFTPNFYFQFTPTCQGTWTVSANALGSPDTNPNDGYMSLTFTVSGGGICPSPTETPTLTPTPAFQASGSSDVILAPVPAKVGDKVCAYFDSAPTQSHWQVYDVDGELVGSFSFGSQDDQCWDTSSSHVAPGLYFVRLDVTTAKQGERVVWKKVVLTR